MKPIRFKEANCTLIGDGCDDLPTFTDGEQSLSLWGMTWKERLLVLLYGRVWLPVRSGETQPPVWISASKTVFEKEDRGEP